MSAIAVPWARPAFGLLCPKDCPCGAVLRYGPGVAVLAYARVSTEKQSLDRQVEALAEAGVDREHIWVDKKSGASTDRPGLRALLAYARDGDVIVAHTMDRLGAASATP